MRGGVWERENGGRLALSEQSWAPHWIHLDVDGRLICTGGTASELLMSTHLPEQKVWASHHKFENRSSCFRTDNENPGLRRTELGVGIPASVQSGCLQEQFNRSGLIFARTSITSENTSHIIFSHSGSFSMECRSKSGHIKIPTCSCLHWRTSVGLTFFGGHAGADV